MEKGLIEPEVPAATVVVIGKPPQEELPKARPLLEFPRSGPLRPPAGVRPSTGMKLEFPKSGPLRPPSKVLSEAKDAQRCTNLEVR